MNKFVRPDVSREHQFFANRYAPRVIQTSFRHSCSMNLAFAHGAQHQNSPRPQTLSSSGFGVFFTQALLQDHLSSQKMG
jgi:hypothetical protein